MKRVDINKNMIMLGLLEKWDDMNPPSDKELIKNTGLGRSTYYKYKRVYTDLKIKFSNNDEVNKYHDQYKMTDWLRIHLLRRFVYRIKYKRNPVKTDPVINIEQMKCLINYTDDKIALLINRLKNLPVDYDNDTLEQEQYIEKYMNSGGLSEAVAKTIRVYHSSDASLYKKHYMCYWYAYKRERINRIYAIADSMVKVLTLPASLPMEKRIETAFKNITKSTSLIDTLKELSTQNIIKIAILLSRIYILTQVHKEPKYAKYQGKIHYS